MAANHESKGTKEKVAVIPNQVPSEDANSWLSLKSQFSRASNFTATLSDGTTWNYG